MLVEVDTSTEHYFPASASRYSNVFQSKQEITRFHKDMAKASNGVPTNSKVIFRTHNSVGFSSHRSLPGDGVFAIDGVYHEFLLREISTNVYRIVGTCYLWDAAGLQRNRDSEQSRHIVVF
jgi:hypothetical protein